MVVHEAGASLDHIADASVTLILGIPNEIRMGVFLQGHARDEVGAREGGQCSTLCDGEAYGLKLRREKASIHTRDGAVKTHGFRDDAAACLRIGLVKHGEAELARVEDDDIETEAALG
jgi:hypothetical protein